MRSTMHSASTAPDLDIADLVVPTAQTDGTNGTPFVNSRWPFVEQCHRMIASKDYVRDESDHDGGAA